MTCCKVIHAQADSGFRKVTDESGHDDGLAMRGANYFRMGERELHEPGERRGHLIHWEVGSIKQKVRSTFTAEGVGLVLTADMLIVLGNMLSEIALGPVSPSVGMKWSEEGGIPFQLELVTDGYNILRALQSLHTKMPAEKSFYSHLLWLKDKLKRGVIKWLIWIDTRDMSADGHTKGSIDRAAINALADGNLTMIHKPECLTLAVPPRK